MTDEGAGQVGTSAYDPNGNLTDDGSQTYYSYQVIEERDGNWALLRRYVYGPGIDEPLSIYDAADDKACFYQRDGLGSVTEIVDDQGEVIERCRYSPYGKLGIYDSSWNELTASAIGNPYFFTGREYDPESGLYYYRARMYSPVLGRFLQTDPIGYSGGLNYYMYANNNPINWVDSFGLDARAVAMGMQDAAKMLWIPDNLPQAEFTQRVIGVGIYAISGYFLIYEAVRVKHPPLSRKPGIAWGVPSDTQIGIPPSGSIPPKKSAIKVIILGTVFELIGKGENIKIIYNLIFPNKQENDPCETEQISK